MKVKNTPTAFFLRATVFGHIYYFIIVYFTEFAAPGCTSISRMYLSDGLHIVCQVINLKFRRHELSNLLIIMCKLRPPPVAISIVVNMLAIPRLNNPDMIASLDHFTQVFFSRRRKIIAVCNGLKNNI